MLILPIEKEIESEHKVLGRFTTRQVVCGGGIIFCVIMFYLLLEDLFWVLLCTMPFLVIFGLLGWYTKFGLPLEDFALKKLQSRYYKNEIRTYRTKNYYFLLLHKAQERQQKEVASKKKQKRS